MTTVISNQEPVAGNGNASGERGGLSRMPAAGYRSRGFTLMEMMVVVFIIALLAAVVIGVSGLVTGRAKVEKTRLTLQTIRAAIEEYHLQLGAYPAEIDVSSATRPGDFTYSNREWQALVRSNNLYNQLANSDKALAKLTGLDSETKVTPYAGKTCFVDGFGKPVEYYSTSAAGGGPLVISAGKDMDYDKAEDNIRSDGQ